MSDKRRGLGRGLGALIPSSASANASGNGSAPSRPVDLFFPEARKRPVDAQAQEEISVAEPPVAERTTTSAASDEAASVRIDEVAASGETGTRPKTAPSKTPSSKAPVRTGGTEEDLPAVPESTGAKKQAGRKATTAKTEAAESVPPAADVASVPLAERDNGVDLVEVPGVRFAEIPVSDIHPNRKQPRSVFDEDDMAELVHSVREIGVLQPIVVRTSTEQGGEPYELVMGERRWRAVQAAGLDTIPAIVRDTTDDDLLRDALLENLHRSQLNPLEEAAAYQQLLEDFGTTHEQLADRIGRSRPQVSNTLRLLKLPPLVQRRVGAGVISAGHARALLALPDAAAMERLAQKIVAEGMSVRATEEAVTLYQGPASPTKNNIPRPGARHERLDYLASSLSDRLDTNVKISLGARKGRVSIEFASVEDLNRIMDVLSPGSPS
ncbi:ParB/RepB/Spo0J family partition protein [Arthrobacter sp. B3I4]|uniref:ParB/RepB/Spo0J family partition protein n=1 Tax=Arthrobacter sp. B3I4 TaxID=3042267 RepID=UPI00277DD930|nr:ParB/RepB/Spo0J family partition protein [Arthrobacter sp. B3I4]MDQ0754733.1 ParB family chromosome partitioning protein [Arthrobacter sp. B3I4]